MIVGKILQLGCLGNGFYGYIEGHAIRYILLLVLSLTVSYIHGYIEGHAIRYILLLVLSLTVSYIYINIYGLCYGTE